MIPEHPDQISLPEPTELAALLVRSARQQAQGLELIAALGGEREHRRWRAAVRLLKRSRWGWMSGFGPCAQRILGVGARRNRLLRRFATDCALQTWRQVPLSDPDLSALWPRPWRTTRRVLARAETDRPDDLPASYALATRDMRWVYRQLSPPNPARQRLYRATQSTRSACATHSGRAAMEAANHAARQESAAVYQGWFLARLMEESGAAWADQTPR